ncbi:MAG: hypothetical protein CTY15_01810 [Methylocystis sp.]|nr:MAG: hypothetical protein CTY15_01810 [Methylocystis sp.]
MFAHPHSKAAAKHFSTRAALMALCFFFLATSGLQQMELACQKSVVKAGRYSLVETNERQWLAPEMRVGWKNREAYIGFSDYALLEAIALGRFSLSTLMYLTPLAWLIAFRLRREEAEEAAPGDEIIDAKPADIGLVPPLAE